MHEGIACFMAAKLVLIPAANPIKSLMEQTGFMGDFCASDWF
jgi:hypothetical protein